MRIFYDNLARNIDIEGLGRYFSSGSLEAIADGSIDVFVRYKDSTTREIQVPFTEIQQENGTSAGATQSQVLDYLNEEFSKGIILGQASFSLLSTTKTVLDSRVRPNNKIMVQPLGSINEILGVTVTNGSFTVTRSAVAVLAGLTSNLTFDWVRL